MEGNEPDLVQLASAATHVVIGDIFSLVTDREHACLCADIPQICAVETFRELMRVYVNNGHLWDQKETKDEP